MSYLWEKEEFLLALEGKIHGNFLEGVHSISIDSRDNLSNAAFFCIKGDRFDGHDFAYEAYKKGAKILVIDEKHQDLFKEKSDLKSIVYIVVDDVLDSLYRLAKFSRKRSKAKIIAVTGSVGKTTTKELLKQALCYRGKVHANPASFNNHWGVPLTLARMPRDTEFAIFEIGMNNANEIRPLSQLVSPDVAIVTRIAPSHLKNFNCLEDIVQAKAEIFESLKENGFILLNHDDEYYDLLCKYAKEKSKASIKNFGRKKESNYTLVSEKFEQNGALLEILLEKQKTIFYLNLPGAHNHLNCLAAVAAIDSLGVDVIPLLGNFSLSQPVEGRGNCYKFLFKTNSEKEKKAYILFLDESYNANPVSMAAALENLENINIPEKVKKIAILGDMLELGKFSKEHHRNLAFPLQKMKINMLFLVGQEMVFLRDEIKEKIPFIWREKIEEIIPDIIKYLTQSIECCQREKYIMMAKSSNNVGTSKLRQYFLKHYQILDEAGSL